MIYNGRYTARIEGDFVVFLIGSRINQWWKIYKFKWIGDAFGAMLTTLAQNPEKGYLGGESFFNLGTRIGINVTYWRSYDALERFAHDKNDVHLGPWREFNQKIGNDGSFGIWHETFLIKANNYEVTYGNMPRFGLANAGEHIKIERGSADSARGRLTGEAIPPYVPPPTN
jgi:hypothetical protein